MPPGDAVRIGEVLIEEGVVTQDELTRAILEGGLKGSPLANLIESTVHVKRADLAAFLAANFRVPVIEDLRRIDIAAGMAQVIPEDLARKHELVPLVKLGNVLCIAKSNYFNRAALQDLRNVVDIKLKVFQGDEEQVRAAIERVYKNRPGELPPPASLRGAPKSSTTVRRLGQQAAAPAPAPVDAVPLIEAPMEEVRRPAARLSDVVDEVIEILDATKIPSQEYAVAARDPLSRMIAEFDDVFQSGRAVAAPRL
ncbi:MAG TPA: hypothetical protein VF950_11060 [Planctomycetota bacterium]